MGRSWVGRLMEVQNELSHVNDSFWGFNYFWYSHAAKRSELFWQRNSRL
jgi:hypothetical protein